MFERISVGEAFTIISGEETLVVDIRDIHSFNSGHIDGAVRIDNTNVQSFLDDADKSKPIIVCCYHGVSSQATAELFSQYGFSRSYSMDGGMSEWIQTQKTITSG